MADQYVVSDYLADRLCELGAHEIFGVPGDFNLRFLDHIVGHDCLRWVGTANELNAGYAADGYARLRGFGAFVTTYGVGELSAVNAVAGSYAEYVPVVHVVIGPTTSQERRGRAIHHSLGDGDFRVYARMHREITCAQAELDQDAAIAGIDRVLASVRDSRRPGYIYIPGDIAEMPTARPAEPLRRAVDITNRNALEDFRDAAREHLAPGKSITVLIDLFAERLGLGDAALNLVEVGKLPYALTPWTYTLVDHARAGYLGRYMGPASDGGARAGVEKAESLISLGAKFTDSTTLGFQHQIDSTRMIDVQSHAARIGERVFAPLSMESAIRALTEIVAERPPEAREQLIDWSDTREAAAEPSAPLTQMTLWREVVASLPDNAVVLTEVGTAFAGLQGEQLPGGIVQVSQGLWSSIGFTLPAALGAALAEPHRRVVLLIGDGSAQLTIQELGTFFRWNVFPIIVLINNDGYTIERLIHGADQSYNDIARWDWTGLARALGPEADPLTARAHTLGELRSALALAQESPDRLAFIEAILPRMDAPELLRALVTS